MSEGVLTKIKVLPGINRGVTEYQAEGAWVSADKMRFHQDIPEKLGGWAKKPSDNSYYGVARAIHPWADLDGVQRVALGTHNSVWIEQGGLYSDITPIRTSLKEVSCFSGTAGSNVVNVSMNTHGGQVDDLIKIETSVELNDSGQTVSAGHYKIVSAGVNHFDVSLPSTEVATSTFTQEGNVSVRIQFLLNAGLKSNGAKYGYGAGTYGTSTYGTPKPVGSGVAQKIRQWSFDNWGEDLLMNQKEGSLYYYEVSSSDRASVVNNAPTKNHFMFLSHPARHIVLCGTCTQNGDFDPMLVRWSDSDDYTEWTAAATNGAGDFRLQKGSLLVGALPAKKEHVLFTDEGAYSMTYTGAPFYFGFDRLGSNCGLVSFNAGVDLNGTLFWMSDTSFYMYDGTVKELSSTLDEAIFSPSNNLRLNLDQKEKVFCGANTEFSEIWWFYPAGTNTENSRYVIFNYETGAWYDGNIVRTTWADSGIFQNPIATCDTSVSTSYYQHEFGANDDGVAMGSFIKSGELQIGEGDTLMYVDQFVPDFTTNAPLKITFTAKKYPQSGEEFVKGPYNINPTTEKKSIRLRGRSMNFQIQCSLIDAEYRLGDSRIRVSEDGER